MQPPKKVVIIAGEESGDKYAGNLASYLLKQEPTLKISGIGGQHMAEAGVTLISDLARFGVTGLVEVLRHIVVIKKAFKAIKAHLRTEKPDLLVLIDYPGFNLRLAKFAKQKLGLRIIYYISPQIWAWKANRIHTLKACVDKMAVILPFEKNIYQQAGVPVSFVGHPLVDNIPHYQDPMELRKALSLPVDGKLVALLPGSRRNEIERHMPVLVKTAELLSRQHQAIHFVIPVAATIRSELIQSYLQGAKNVRFTLIEGKMLPSAACSDGVVVASGTASLECALLARPMCIIYKTSLLTYIAAVKLIKVKFLGLCNLLMNDMVVPEFLQYDCNAAEIARTVSDWLTDPQKAQSMVARLQSLKQSLSGEEADLSIEALVARELGVEVRRTSVKRERFTIHS
ncbi:lipid-A-disaccharide synthase [Legionella spiritensis]|uniref:lipid-A-disaccharide synthase n=1 Tax=Legionella spiritensis TaxID=452 RepID=UPI000F6ED90E|nr:lipid-A-disaccharide synthase [Legionella spiritensis]VEG90084.1 lipid-A-disaccharide synthase [Legionella spiritensis]